MTARRIFQYEVPLLDHGYLKLIDHWGSEEGIIEAARMSTSKSFLGWGPSVEARDVNGREILLSKWQMQRLVEGGDGAALVEAAQQIASWKTTTQGDEKLLRRLYTHRHASPFEMAGLTIEVQAPIFVFREWHRHRTQSYNELSARYTPLPDENYMPNLERCMFVNPENKQANRMNGSMELTHEAALEWLENVSNLYSLIENVYQKGLTIGIPKEVARIVVPVGRYSRMRASSNLRNWLSFLTLRNSRDAQWEIRQFAGALSECISSLFHRTHALYTELGRGP